MSVEEVYNWKFLEYHQSIFNAIISEIQGSKIAENLHAFTKLPHPAGTLANNKVAEKISEIWKAIGLQNVHFIKYDVLLSYPDYSNPNHMQILDINGDVLYTTKGISPVIIAEEQSHKGAGIQWLAYSANGTVEGQIVYCNYGRIEDFQRLKQFGIDPKGKIVMMRYGRGHRSNKVRNAQIQGAIGAILFSDPAEVARDGILKEKVYPNTEWMPNKGVQRGLVMLGNGDPLSPLYPSKENLYRSRTVEEAIADGILPKIPVIPLSYSDAYQILIQMAGRLAPTDWQGGLNISYYIGPNMKIHEGKIRLTVHSSLSTRTIRNVVGYIRGTTDPDRYVIIGNHYDAWVYGSLDPNSGTAILAEVARALVKTMKDKNWKPARTIMFCNWDAEEFGLIGSTEFVEEYANLLSQRAVVYLNVDNINSNKSLFSFYIFCLANCNLEIVCLHVSTVPTLYRTLSKISKQIANPMESEKSHGRKSLYETWIKTFPSDIDFLPDIPSMPIPGGGSDHAPFLNYLGVPVAAITYRNKTMYGSYPLYHSMYETPFTNEHIFDTNNLAVHEAVGKYWAGIALEFADAIILPINVTDLAVCILNIYIPSIVDSIKELKKFENILRDAKRQLYYLIKATIEFVVSARKFNACIGNILLENDSNLHYSRKLASVNDRLMAVERCFINPRGVTPEEPTQRHLLFSVSNNNKYSGKAINNIHDIINTLKNAKSQAERDVVARQLTIQISVLQTSIECATSTLKDNI
ncbi:unnamed protein product [Thelazia callipaeda]|uniref:N-acetylated-alpha-linked acidic dipeptidase 2 n=1 Tax=Thelazia callipaeda TaxID=103827 RepID=A0A0N5D3R6_THECL|nr:unnamed protein product [Thelazia callipaeda]